MYQSVGTMAAKYIAEAMALPLYVDDITGTGMSTGKDYTPTVVGFKAQCAH